MSAASETALAFGHAQPERIVRFGCGVLAEIDQLVDELGRSRVLAFVTPSQQTTGGRIQDVLGQRLVATSLDIPARVPIEAVQDALGTAKSSGADVLVALGGGSAIGLAKAVAARTGLPIVAVPTTYSGSEMTSIYGVTAAGRKHGGHDPVVAPRAILYDPELTVSMPAQLTASSGMNALAQAIGGLYTQATSPVSTLLAGEGIRRLVSALPRCVDDPAGPAARSEALFGAHLCGWALSMTGVSAHHDLAHNFGDLTRLPHAAVHATLLPQTTHWATARHRLVGTTLRTVLGTDDPAGVIYDLLKRLNAPSGWADLGLSADAFETARAAFYRDLPARWQDEDRTALDELLARTYAGSRPPSDS
jgi:maleylacetate reductase